MSRISTDFCSAAYEQLLDDFSAAGYRPIDYASAHRLTRFDEPWLLLRHDIDFCVQAARDMANLEARNGFFATYFFLVRTPFYNLLTPENSDAVREILKQGHRIGVHFDRTTYPAGTPPSKLAESCRKEAKLLSDWFETEINVTSYHRPDEREKQGRPEDSHPLLNTYMETFFKKFKYCSDSQGAFHYGHPQESEAFQKRQAMHLLIHPIWWGTEKCSPLERLRQFVASRGNRDEENVARSCKVYRVGLWSHITD